MTYDSAEYDVPPTAPGELWRGTSAFLPRERSKEAQDRFPDDLQTLEVLEEVIFFNTVKARTPGGSASSLHVRRSARPKQRTPRARRGVLAVWPRARWQCYCTACRLDGANERHNVSGTELVRGDGWLLRHDAACGCRQAATRFYRDATPKTERLSVHAPDDYIVSPIVKLAPDKARAPDATVSGMLAHACSGLDVRPEACGAGCTANAFCMLGGSASTTN